MMEKAYHFPSCSTRLRELRANSGGLCFECLLDCGIGFVLACFRFRHCLASCDCEKLTAQMMAQFHLFLGRALQQEHASKCSRGSV